MRHRAESEAHRGAGQFSDNQEAQISRGAYEKLEKAYRKIREQKEQLESEQQRFRIAVKNTSVIIFEYEFATDLYTAYGTLEEEEHKGSRIPMNRTIPNFTKIYMNRVIHTSYLGLVHDLLYESEKKEAEIQVIPYEGAADYIWVKVYLNPIMDEKSRIVKLIGKISNIESEKKKELALDELKSRDSLTGLYNKTTGIEKIREYLKQKEPQEIDSLLLFDMDNFEKLNETEGEVFADAVLQDVADILRNEIGMDDIPVRLGGDEFMLFVKNCNKAAVGILAPKIANLIQELSVDGRQNLKITASIGMCTTSVVSEYSGLYRCAESTLKYVKENGKGRAACYRDTSAELGTMLTQVYPERHFINEIDSTMSIKKESLISFALDFLGKSKNLNDAIFLLLSRIGRSCQLDRVSILEVNHEYLSCRVNYQWAKNRVDLRIGEDHYISQEEWQNLINAYDKDGLCNRNFIAEVQNIGSCLHAGIWDYGSYFGGMYFEVYEKNYEWTAEQREMLAELAKIVSSFMLKARADAVSQAKTEFLSRMSHEIRTPMNAITGMTTIAKAVVGDQEKTLDCLNKIETAASYLLELINDVLDMSRIESGKVELNRESMDLVLFIKNLEKLMRPQSEAKQLHFIVDCDLLYSGKVMADSLRLNQILINMIGNALKFTPPGGKIILAAKQIEQSERQIRIQFSIRDTGIGIGKEAITRIFNAFEQAEKDTSANYGGTGLGLAISSRLVQMMGGKLEVKSEVDSGTDFYFTLSFFYSDEQETDSKKEEIEQEELRPEYEFNGIRILVAEDNELNLEIAETILTMSGFTVESAKDGKAALNCFCSHEPYYYQGILMDIRMPIMDGLESSKRIRTSGRADARSIPIIAMTANAFDEDTKKSMESGMNEHLSKPIDVDKMLATLKKCIRN